jgi:ubiquinone/menaquinone biosynthesis C-methylase UbiE
MKRLNSKDINNVKYWDEHIAKPDYGLRQKKYLQLAGKGERLIELGCGLSPFLDKAKASFDEVYGLDFSQETLFQARQRYPQVRYIHGSVLKTDIFPDKCFDVCVAGELIEHLEEPQKLIEEMKRITKRRIILSSAHMEYNDPEHLWLIEAKDFPEAKTEEIESKWFPGRVYLFIIIDLCQKSLKKEL